MTYKIDKTETEWQAQLTPEQYVVCRKKGTERAFNGKYHACKESGVYHCVSCGADLCDATVKFDPGPGWPSFWEPVSAESVVTETDRSWFMYCTGVLCNQCGMHMGHVFEDGPAPMDLRYCINSVDLELTSRQ